MFKSQIKLAVLRKLSVKDLNGYELMRELGINLGKKPSPGYIYPLLNDLKTKKFIKEKKSKNKNIYSITDSGRKLLKELSKKHEETIKKMIKTFEPISDKEETNSFLKFMNRINNIENVPKDLDIWHDFRKEMGILKENNYDKKRKEFRSIMETTIKQLKKVNQKWKNQ